MKINYGPGGDHGCVLQQARVSSRGSGRDLTMSAYIDLDLAADAHISCCGTWRYLLSRVWVAGSHNLLPWIMLNPSSADHRQDDPTIRRVCGFSRAAGFAGAVVMNLFALRAPEPNMLRQAEDPVGPDNAAMIRHGLALCRTSQVVCAWGTRGGYQGQAERITSTLRSADRQLVCLGLTQGGHPRHPLYIAAQTAFTPYSPDPG